MYSLKDFLTFKMLQVLDEIMNYRSRDYEPLHETQLRFQKTLQHFPDHGLLYKVLLQIFY